VDEIQSVAGILRKTVLLKRGEQFIDFNPVGQPGQFFLLLNAEKVRKTKVQMTSLTWGYKMRRPISFRTSYIRTGKELVGALAFTNRRLMFLERRDGAYVQMFDLPYSQITGVADAKTSRIEDPLLRKRPYFVVSRRGTEYRFYHPQADYLAEAVRNVTSRYEGTSTPSSVKYCANCGVSMAVGAKYCPKCGLASG